MTASPTMTPDPAAQRQAAPPPGKRFDLLAFARKHRTILFLLLLIAVFGTVNERFLTVRNALNILSEVSIYGIIAVGMTYVILIGGIDVAVGSLLAFASIAAAYVVTNLIGGGPATWLIALAISTLVGFLGGLIQGKAVTWLHVPAFIVTLGGMTVWRGATLLLNDGGPISGFDEAYRWWGTGQILFVPVPIVVFGLVALVGHVVLRYTRYGRQIYAVGGNAEAARLSGVNVDFIVTSVYAVIGALAGLSGFLLSARLGSSEAVAGTGYELRVIASVVIGGASLTGGSGNVGGTILGALLIGVLSNGLVIMHVTSYFQQVVIGLIIVAAVAFDHYARTHKA
jgi:inositol transport system permease protein